MGTGKTYARFAGRCGFLQTQGFFPQPMQRLDARRLLDFLIDGVSISTNFFQSLVRCFGFFSALIVNLLTDAIRMHSIAFPLRLLVNGVTGKLVLGWLHETGFGAAGSTAGATSRPAFLGTRVTRKSPNSSSRTPE